VSFVNPLATGPTVIVTAVAAAEGARGAAAALACEGADADRPALFVDLGGRAPRPTLLASAAAQALERRISAHLPAVIAAARGQVCHLAVPADPGGFEAISAALAVARGALAVVHLRPEALHHLLDHAPGPRPTGVLLRADLDADRALVALAAADLVGRGLTVAVLKNRLPWVTERRAFFGALPAGAAGLPPRLVKRLAPASRGTEEPVPVPELAS
jgi:hypothetical protein